MLALDNIRKTRCVLIYPINKMYAISEKKKRYQRIKWKYTVRNSKKTKLNKKKQKNTCNYTVICMCTRTRCCNYTVICMCTRTRCCNYTVICMCTRTRCCNYTVICMCTRTRCCNYTVICMCTRTRCCNYTVICMCTRTRCCNYTVICMCTRTRCCNYTVICMCTRTRCCNYTVICMCTRTRCCNYTVICMCTRMIFAAVLSPTIKIFHRHLGPNLYIFTTISPTFYDISLPFHCEKTLTKLISCYKSLWHDKSL